MADISLSYYAPVIRIGEGEQTALFVCITTGLAALTLRDFPRLDSQIRNALIEIQSTYCKIADTAITVPDERINHAELITLTLQAFEKNRDAGSACLCAYLETLEKLINDIVTVVSVTYGLQAGFDSYFSAHYDKLIDFMHRLESVLLSGRGYSGKSFNRQKIS
jgi:hypothetical protein